MRLFITSDSNWEAGIDGVLNELINSGIGDFFERRNYGSSLDGISIIITCRNPELNLKQRIRLSKKEKKLYLDIMLDLNLFKKIDQNTKEREIAKTLISEVSKHLSKYRFYDFDLLGFESDIKIWMKKMRWL